MTLNFVEIGSIALICLIFGQVLKCTPMATKWIPVLVAAIGGVLGTIGHYAGIPGLCELNIFDAIATGIFSGAMSSGLFSLYKNLSGAYEDNN